MATLYPIEIDVKVHVTNGKGKNGVATYAAQYKRVPTHDKIKDILSEVVETLPRGFRLMTRHESETFVIREKFGAGTPVMALSTLADGDEWHDPETANQHFFEEESMNEEGE